MMVARSCPQCGAELPADAPEQPCPACLMKLGLESWHARRVGSSGNISSPTELQPQSFTAPLPEELASRFPQFEVLELLGHGGMGAVYKARQRSLDRIVALKIIRPEAVHESGFAERFAREAKALARLSHPNIVTVHDFGQSDGLYYFVMEYVDGTNLRQVLQRGRMESPQALRTVAQICEALQYAHDQGIVHRDIKPENILLNRQGRVKMADFGLAKIVRTGDEELSLTGTHQVMGTPRYMAPEQMQGSRRVDHRADIYSLGVVFYEMLTGELPVGRFEPPSSRVQIDVRLDEVVLRALETQPERRYQRASDLGTALRAVSAGADLDSKRDLPDVGDEQSDTVRSLPFEFSAHGGFSTGRGIARIDETALVLEFRVTVLDTVPLQAKKTQIPFGVIESIELRPGWVGASLIIRTTTSEPISEFPSSDLGEVRLHIRRRDYEQVEQFVAAVQRRLPTGSSAGTVPDRKAAAPVAQTVVDEQVRRAGFWLLIAGLVNMIITPAVMLYFAPSRISAEAGAPPTVWLAPALLILLSSSIVVVAGFLIRRCRGYWLGVLGSILAILTPPSIPLGFVAGIYGLAVLSDPDVRAGFSSRRSRSRAPWLFSTGFWGVLLSLGGIAVVFLPWAEVYYRTDEYRTTLPGTHWEGVWLAAAFSLGCLLMLIATSGLRTLPWWRPAGLGLSGGVILLAAVEFLGGNHLRVPREGPYLALGIGAGLLLLAALELRDVLLRSSRRAEASGRDIGQQPNVGPLPQGGWLSALPKAPASPSIHSAGGLGADPQALRLAETAGTASDVLAPANSHLARVPEFWSKTPIIAGTVVFLATFMAWGPYLRPDNPNPLDLSLQSIGQSTVGWDMSLTLLRAQINLPNFLIGVSGLAVAILGTLRGAGLYEGRVAVPLLGVYALLHMGCVLVLLCVQGRPDISPFVVTAALIAILVCEWRRSRRSPGPLISDGGSLHSPMQSDTANGSPTSAFDGPSNWHSTPGFSSIATWIDHVRHARSPARRLKLMAGPLVVLMAAAAIAALVLLR